MRKAVDWLMRVLSLLIGVLLAASVAVVVAQILWRYALRRPLGWTDQLCRFLYVWIIMLGLPVLFHDKGVTAFDFLSGKLKPRAQKVLHCAVCLLAIFFSVCWCVFSIQFMMKKGGMTIPAFKVVPYHAVYASMPVSAVLVCVEMLLQLSETLREMLPGREAK